MSTKFKKDQYIDQIIELLSQISTQVSINNSIHRFDINIGAEDFFAGFLNILMGWELTNENRNLKKNAVAIDLCDRKNRIAVQVTSTHDIRRKIKNTLKKYNRAGYSREFDRLIIFFIHNKRITITKPIRYEGDFKFSTEKDIWSITNLIQIVNTKDILTIETLVKYFKQHIRDYSISDITSNQKKRLIWAGAKAAYNNSHKIGNRFYQSNVIEKLLPSGYIMQKKEFTWHFDTKGVVDNIHTICDSTSGNITITGEGGIGKTTYLQKLLNDYYRDHPSYEKNTTIPIYIELYRCPEDIINWYQPKHEKTNFITRYIADLVYRLSDDEIAEATETEGEHLLGSFCRNKEDITIAVEEELRRNSNNKKPSFLLLLDGFNEVSSYVEESGESVRSLLSNEIVFLSQCSNVRIVVTSRITQSAGYINSNSFQRVMLLGLQDSDIVSFLEEKKVLPYDIEDIKANSKLMECLRIPLFILMFCSTSKNSNPFLPETRGEILYQFFHKNGDFYNLKVRAKDAGNNPLKSEYATEILLDFVLPYIAWNMLQSDSFSISKEKLEEVISNLYFEPSDASKSICSVFPAYNNFDSVSASISELRKANIQTLLNCICDYLSIMYCSSTSNQNSSTVSKDSYSFIHHYFRDYFSAIWNIHILKFLVKNQSKNKAFYSSVINTYWNENETAIIGQILNEHHNTPRINPNNGNWIIPEPKTEEQSILLDVLTYCHDVAKDNQPHQHSILIQNVMNTISCCRGELSGIDFSNLDLSDCNLHNMQCYRKGKTRNLVANFINSKLSKNTLMPKEHLNPVEQCIYYKNYCFSVDISTLVKCWDIISGNEICCFQSDPDAYSEDLNPAGIIKLSPDGHFLGVKMNNPVNGKYVINSWNIAWTEAMTISKSQKDHKFISPGKNYKKIDDFAYLESGSEKVVLLLDRCNLKIMNGPKSLCTANKLPFSRHSVIISVVSSNLFYVLSYEYSGIDAEFDNMEYDYEGDEASESQICYIYSCSYRNKKIKADLLFSFFSKKYTMPSISYVNSSNCFLYYDYQSNSFVKYNCESKYDKEVLGSIPTDREYLPSIHYVPNSNGICYIIFDTECYQIKTEKGRDPFVLLKLEPPPLIANNSDFKSSELFYFHSVPDLKHILLKNEEGETFEYSIENESLSHKYNIREYDTIALKVDKGRDIGILVHAQNGISFFSLSGKQLIDSISFSSEDYRIGIADYSPERGLLALAFERGMHRYLEILNIDSYERKRIYSSQRLEDCTMKLSFGNKGNELVFCDSANCYIYDVVSGRIDSVYKSKNNEQIADAYFSGNDIHIGIVPARSFLTPIFDPKCLIAVRKNNNSTYQIVGGYYLPEIVGDESNFVHERNHMGNLCCFKPDGLQSYYVSKGFFINQNISKETNSIRIFKTDSEYKLNIEIGPLNMIMVKHPYALKDYSKSDDSFINSYCFLSSDFSEVIILRNSEIICYWDEMKKHPAKPTYTFDYRETIETEALGAYAWDYVIPAGNSSFICCFESYNLLSVDVLDAHSLSDIEYIPGLSVSRCLFTNVQADDEIKDILRENGAIV